MRENAQLDFQYFIPRPHRVIFPKNLTMEPTDLKDTREQDYYQSLPHFFPSSICLLTCPKTIIYSMSDKIFTFKLTRQ